MDLVSTMAIIESTIAFHLKVTKYQKIHIKMIMKINLMLLIWIIDFQGLLKNQVSQVKVVGLMMMELSAFLVLVYLALEDKRKESPKPRLWTKMIYGCKIWNLKCMKFFRKIIKIVCLNGFLIFKVTIKIKFLIIPSIIFNKIINNFKSNFKI